MGLLSAKNSLYACVSNVLASMARIQNDLGSMQTNELSFLDMPPGYSERGRCINAREMQIRRLEKL